MEYEQSMAMRDAYIDSTNILFSSITFNALISMDKMNGEFRYVKSFADECWKKGLHRRVIKYNRSLFFFPDVSKGITKYSLDTGEMAFFKSKEEFLDLSDAIMFGKNAYLIPQSLKQPLYIFDMEKCCYESKNSWNSRIMEKVNTNTEIKIWPPCIAGRTIWILLTNLNVVVETFIDSWELEFYYFDKSILFNSITSDGENIWLSSETDDVVICWNKNIGVIKKYVMSDFRSNKSVKDISRLIFLQDKLFVLPKEEKELFIIDLSGNVNVITIPHLQHVPDPERGNLFPLFSRCIVYDEEAYLLPWAADKMYKLSLITYDITEFDMTFRDIKSYYMNILWNAKSWQDINPILEGESGYTRMSLTNYFYMIDKDLGENKGKVERKEGYGRNIYKSISNSI